MYISALSVLLFHLNSWCFKVSWILNVYFLQWWQSSVRHCKPLSKSCKVNPWCPCCTILFLLRPVKLYVCSIFFLLKQFDVYISVENPMHDFDVSIDWSNDFVSSSSGSILTCGSRLIVAVFWLWLRKLRGIINLPLFLRHQSLLYPIFLCFHDFLLALMWLLIFRSNYLQAFLCSLLWW